MADNHIWIRLENWAGDSEQKRKNLERYLERHPEIGVARYRYRSRVADCFCLETEKEAEDIAKECPGLSLNIFGGLEGRTMYVLGSAPRADRIEKY